MAEEVLQRTITEAPDYLKPGIEKYLEGATLQAGQAMDTSQFAPQVAGLGALQLLQTLILKLHKVYHNLQRMLLTLELSVGVEKA